MDGVIGFKFGTWTLKHASTLTHTTTIYLPGKNSAQTRTPATAPARTPYLPTPPYLPLPTRTRGRRRGDAAYPHTRARTHYATGGSTLLSLTRISLSASRGRNGHQLIHLPVYNHPSAATLLPTTTTPACLVLCLPCHRTTTATPATCLPYCLPLPRCRCTTCHRRALPLHLPYLLYPHYLPARHLLACLLPPSPLNYLVCGWAGDEQQRHYTWHSSRFDTWARHSRLDVR